MVQLELAAVGRGDLDRRRGPAVRTVGGGVDAVRLRGVRVSMGERRCIRSREGFVQGLVHAAVFDGDVVVDVLAELFLGIGEFNAVLRTLGTGDGGNNRG